jgi:hypothetical protein
MTIRFIINLDSGSWDQYGKIDSNEFEVDLCMYVPFKTKVKNFSQDFHLLAIGEDIDKEEVEFFVQEKESLPEFSARIFTSYKIRNLRSSQIYKIMFSVSNLRKKFSDFFIFKTN